MIKMKKYENFCKSLTNLEMSIDIEPPYRVVEVSGLVNLFSMTFEQACKMMKELLTYHGYSESATGSPRMIIKTAYEASMIDDAECWLNALASRNEAAHAYNEDVSESIILETKTKYVKLFQKLKETVDKNWIDV